MFNYNFLLRGLIAASSTVVCSPNPLSIMSESDLAIMKREVNISFFLFYSVHRQFYLSTASQNHMDGCQPSPLIEKNQ